MSFRQVRPSKFRNVFGTAWKREQCYDNIRVSKYSWDSTFCSVNPKFIAVITESAGGGAFIVLPLIKHKVGRVSADHPLVAGHRGPVLDIAWSPHNDNLIASGSEDCVVKIWDIPDEGLTKTLTESSVDLIYHQRRVGLVLWHPSAQDVLLTAGSDNLVVIWNVGTGEPTVVIDAHPDLVYSACWNWDGSHFLTTCRDKRIRILNPRTGHVVEEAICHESSKTTRAIYLRNGLIFTTGFSKMNERQYSLRAPQHLNDPIVMVELDTSNGVMFPFYDADTNMVYLCGKGDSVIRYFEVTPDPPFVHYINKFQSPDAQRGIGMMPKRGCDVTSCEITRFFRLNNSGLCQIVSMTVPRKMDEFQEAEIVKPETFLLRRQQQQPQQTRRKSFHEFCADDTPSSASDKRPAGRRLFLLPADTAPLTTLQVASSTPHRSRSFNGLNKADRCPTNAITPSPECYLHRKASLPPLPMDPNPELRAQHLKARRSLSADSRLVGCETESENDRKKNRKKVNKRPPFVDRCDQDEEWLVGLDAQANVVIAPIASGYTYFIKEGTKKKDGSRCRRIECAGYHFYDKVTAKKVTAKHPNARRCNQATSCIRKKRRHWHDADPDSCTDAALRLLLVRQFVKAHRVAQEDPTADWPLHAVQDQWGLFDWFEGWRRFTEGRNNSDHDDRDDHGDPGNTKWIRERKSSLHSFAKTIRLMEHSRGTVDSNRVLQRCVDILKQVDHTEKVLELIVDDPGMSPAEAWAQVRRELDLPVVSAEPTTAAATATQQQQSPQPIEVIAILDSDEDPPPSTSTPKQASKSKSKSSSSSSKSNRKDKPLVVNKLRPPIESSTPITAAGGADQHGHKLPAMSLSLKTGTSSKRLKAKVTGDKRGSAGPTDDKLQKSLVVSAGGHVKQSRLRSPSPVVSRSRKRRHSSSRTHVNRRVRRRQNRSPSSSPSWIWRFSSSSSTSSSTSSRSSSTSSRSSSTSSRSSSTSSRSSSTSTSSRSRGRSRSRRTQQSPFRTSSNHEDDCAHRGSGTLVDVPLGLQALDEPHERATTSTANDHDMTTSGEAVLASSHQHHPLQHQAPALHQNTKDSATGGQPVRAPCQSPPSPKLVIFSPTENIDDGSHPDSSDSTGLFINEDPPPPLLPFQVECVGVTDEDLEDDPDLFGSADQLEDPSNPPGGNPHLQDHHVMVHRETEERYRQPSPPPPTTPPLDQPSRQPIPLTPTANILRLLAIKKSHYQELGHQITQVRKQLDDLVRQQGETDVKIRDCRREMAINESARAAERAARGTYLITIQSLGSFILTI